MLLLYRVRREKTRVRTERVGSGNRLLFGDRNWHPVQNVNEGLFVGVPLLQPISSLVQVSHKGMIISPRRTPVAINPNQNLFKRLRLGSNGVDPGECRLF
jgi:hypothetical protein